MAEAETPNTDGSGSPPTTDGGASAAPGGMSPKAGPGGGAPDEAGAAMAGGDQANPSQGPQDKGDAVPARSPTDALSTGGPEPKAPRPNPITISVMAAIAVIGVLLILAAWRIWPFDTPVKSTDDAYVAGRVTVMAPQVSGYVQQVLVHDYQKVLRNQALVKIDDRMYRQQVAQAKGQLDLAIANFDNSVQTVNADRAQLGAYRADLQGARAELYRATLDNERLEPLALRGSISRRERDQGLATLRGASAAVDKALANVRIGEERIKSDLVAREGLAAQIETARAQYRLAEINLANTVVYAPHDGQVSDMSVREGQYVQAGSQLVYFVPPQIWVVANFKETQTRAMLPRQPVELSVDALGGHRLTGHVETFAPATGAQFSVLKPDNATGNFTKIVQRVPVRIRIDPDQAFAGRLRPGLSVVARVDTISGQNRDRCYDDDPDRPGRSRDIGGRSAEGRCGDSR